MVRPSQRPAALKARRRGRSAEGFELGVLYLSAALTLSSCNEGPSGPDPAPPHEVEVSIQTNGVDPDQDGYILRVGSGGQRLPIDSNDLIEVRLPAGLHRIELTEIAQNCGLNGANPFYYTVPDRAAELSLALKVTCMGPGPIVFGSGDHPQGVIRIVYGVGVASRNLFAGADPEWSRDGSRLAFTNSSCAAITTFYDGSTSSCTFRGVATVDPDVGELVQVTLDGFQDPSWSPDGSALVFELAGNLFMGFADGSSVFGTRLIFLPAEILQAREPSWSPTGERIAFSCIVGGTTDICISNVDGSDYHSLTRDVGIDRRPAWSPDGNYIAFHTRSSASAKPVIVVMASDGSSRVELGEGMEPSWSPNGLQIVYNGVSRTSSGVEIRGLHVANVDGSGSFWLGLSGVAPSWRR